MITLAVNIFRVQPSLAISYEDLNKAFSIVEGALVSYTEGRVLDEILECVKGW